MYMYSVAAALEDATSLLAGTETDPQEHPVFEGFDFAEILSALEEVVRKALDATPVVENDPQQNEENLVSAMTAVALRAFVAGRWFSSDEADEDAQRLHVPIPAEVVAALVANGMRGGGVVGIDLEVV